MSPRRKAILVSALLATLTAWTFSVVLARRFESLMRIQSAHELYPIPQPIDINGDRYEGLITVSQPSPEDRFDLRLVIEDDGRRLLELPYDHTDGTYRTHVAARRNEVPMRLVIYDGTSGPGTVRRDTYCWNGSSLALVAPDAEDALILEAMEAHDDTGTFGSWIIWRAASTLLALGLSGILIAVCLGPSLWRAINRPA